MKWCELLEAIKPTCFGVLGLKPWELMKFTPRELFQALEGLNQDREDLRKFALVLTCHLMNSTGNYKKPVTIDDLYPNKDEITTEETMANKDYLAEVTKRFGGRLNG
jgi:hypothetical protein